MNPARRHRVQLTATGPVFPSTRSYVRRPCLAVPCSTLTADIARLRQQRWVNRRGVNYYGLAYASTREPPYQRNLDRANRIRKQLVNISGSAFAGDYCPRKPKRMRWKAIGASSVATQQVQLRLSPRILDGGVIESILSAAYVDLGMAFAVIRLIFFSRTMPPLLWLAARRPSRNPAWSAQ